MKDWKRYVTLEPAMLRWQSRPLPWLIGLALLLALQISPHWLPMNDACGYISMGRSVAQGQGIMYLGTPHWRYPPGYSLLISPIFLLGDRPFLALSVFQWLAMVALMLGVYVWARRVLPEAALWITALTVVNSGLWIQYRRTLSEVAFMAMIMWIVNLFHTVVHSRKPAVLWAGAAAGIALTTFLCLVRQAGMTLAGGVCAGLLCLAISKQLSWRRAIIIGGLVAFATVLTNGLVVLRQQETGRIWRKETYLAEFDEPSITVAGRLCRGAQTAVSDTGRIVIPGMLKSYGAWGKWFNINMVVYVPLAMLLVWGWWKWTRHSPDFLAWTMPFYMALFVVWSADSGARYAVPMIPGLLVCLWYALRPLGIRRLGLLGLLLIAHMVAAVAFWLSVDVPLARRHDAQWASVDAVAAKIADEPGPIAVARPSVPGFGIMLAVTLDRTVFTHLKDVPAPAGLRWLVMPRDLPMAQGFTRTAEVGDYQVLAPAVR
jgi:hypothetical protein